MQTATLETLKQAADHLMAHDPILKPVIVAAGICTITPHREYYRALVESIIGQQLSVKAARSIRGRFLAFFGGTFPSAEQLLGASAEELRSVGLSRAKAQYVHDLAKHVTEGMIQFTQLDQLSNDTIIAELTAVKGIGEWTAHMFLMFCMGRLDVLPTGDLGIRNGIRSLYGFDAPPTPEQIAAVAERNQWHPYESVASWYVWKSLDNMPKV